MTRLRQVLIVLAGLALATGMVVMGIWQLRVYISQGAEAAAARAAQPPLPLTTVAPAGAAVRDGYGRSVVATGRYDPGLQVLVDTPGGGGLRVLTGLRQDDGSLVAVVRGVVAAAPAPPPPTGPVHAIGVLLPSEQERGSAPPGAPSDAIRIPELAQTWPGPLVDGYLTLPASAAAAQGLTPAPLRLPEARGRLRNGAYAFQWWLFAGFTLVMATRMARDLGPAGRDRAPSAPVVTGGST